MPKRPPLKQELTTGKSTPKSRLRKTKAPQTKTSNELGFQIVALGASAGGLEAFEYFFKTMPPNTGMAFILIAHLDPTHISLLPELIQKRTKMQVHKINDGTRVEPNHVYVIPPNKELRILNGTLQLMKLAQPHGTNLPIDAFFHSLASDQGANATCIILSGTGTDGTLGLKTIKDKAGLVMVQSKDSAKYDGMPGSASATGLADYVLPPEEMPEQLINHIRQTTHTKHIDAPQDSITAMASSNALQKIYIILRAQTGHDFSLYKKNTICRRIERRMNVHQVDDINEYVRYLQKSEREIDILFRELLIGVTKFFRDPEIFDQLRDVYLNKYLMGKPNDYIIRAWVTGCSSGEEAYSLAITLQECMQQLKRHFNVQIFGTDIDENAISIARTGLYPKNIENNVSPERLKRYFTNDEDGYYRINKSIREMLVFASQNIIKDPPFTKLDILCCRNLLIYLSSELQKKLFPVFHFSLKQDGILFLGSSETIGQQNIDLFTTLDKKGKVFSRNAPISTTHSVPDFPALPNDNLDRIILPENTRKPEETSMLQLVETILQKSNTPPCAIIDDDCNIVYIHGHIGRYLEPPEGKISVNILQMARPGLKTVLSNAIRKVAIHKQEIYKRGLQIDSDRLQITINLSIKPILEQGVMPGLMMVVFEEVANPSLQVGDEQVTTSKKIPAKPHKDILRELQHTKENLQTTIEELEAANEELKSTNEELQSTNEELQSTNEEMETSKEELQSLNEESATVNTELQSRIDELSSANDDMKNLLDSTDIATVFLDADLCIRRFTPQMTNIIPLTITDLGRPIKHFATNLIDIDLTEQSRLVLQDLVTRETEVISHDNQVFNLKIRPYRTTNHLIDGVVVTFEDVTLRKHVEMKHNEMLQRYRLLFDLSRDSVMLIDAMNGQILESNHEAHNRLGYTAEEFNQLTLKDIDFSESSGMALEHINHIVAEGSDTFTTQHRTKTGKICNVQVRAKVIEIDEKKYLLCTWYDI